MKVGQLKGSSDGSKIAAAYACGLHPLEVYDFNNQTGAISNPVISQESSRLYGVECSLDGSLLYASTGSRIRQYDLNTWPLIGQVIGYTSPSELGLLQLGPDGKIYCARRFSSFLGVINNPNVLGLGCNFNPQGVTLTEGYGTYGLPTFFSSIFNPNLINYNLSGFCFGDATYFSVPSSVDAVYWDFGDPASGLNNNSSILSQ